MYLIFFKNLFVKNMNTYFYCHKTKVQSMSGLSLDYDLEEEINKICKCGLRYVTVVENCYSLLKTVVDFNRTKSILPNK